MPGASNGKARRMSLRASVPPVEAPMAMIASLVTRCDAVTDVTRCDRSPT